jgi:hypothetical protein
VPKGKTHTLMAKTAVITVIHQGAVGGKSKATETPTTKGEEFLKVAVALKSNLPKNSKMLMNNKELSLVYIIRQEANQIDLQYSAAVNTPYIDANQYEELRTFWEEMVNKNNLQIVLKKTMQP